MKIIMTGGGTGGHIYPAIAIADKFKKEIPNCEILFVGTEKGLEKTLVPQNGYPIEFIDVQGFNRKHLTKNVETLKKIIKGTKESKKIVNDFKPDVVIGTGGYVCGPLVREASKLGVPTFVHEQNAFPGMTNKMLEKYVKNVFVSFDEAREYFKSQDKLYFSGNPVRASFFSGSREEARKALGIGLDKFVVLSFGGSLGARTMNNCMSEIASKLCESEGIEVYLGTGKNYFKSMEENLPKLDNLHVLEYIKDMDNFLKAADVVITRAGALSVSEICVVGRAAILIPSPNVTGNHQYFNAKAVADKGGAFLIEEKDLKSELVYEKIIEIKNDKDLQKSMEDGAKKAAPGDACQLIFDKVMNTIY